MAGSHNAEHDGLIRQVIRHVSHVIKPHVCAPRFEFGLVHTTVLSTYQPICGGGLPCKIYNPGLNVGPSGSSDQYIWLAKRPGVGVRLPAHACNCL